MYRRIISGVLATRNAGCVGVDGLAIGAGIGTLQGLHGLVLDSLVSVYLVTAPGSLITVYKISHPNPFDTT